VLSTHRRHRRSPRWGRPARLGVALVTAIASWLLAAPVAQARPVSPTGNDVSWPQCGKTLPTGQAFGIVGVNGGKASTVNPCFATELAWAKRSTGIIAAQPRASVYLNTGNPGDVYLTDPGSVSYWPHSGSNAYGTCSGGDDRACAYEYGKYWATRDVQIVSQTDPGAAYYYWLDVETSNSWNADTSTNQADLTGMVDYLHSVGVTVGVYSTAYQWGQIVGSVSDPANHLTGLDNWRAGATSLSGAESNCSLAPLTPGARVVLTQYVAKNLDYDYSCS
jgi:hypothetical protein